jgi:actin-like ATPase involved in cell morphogenesis
MTKWRPEGLRNPALDLPSDISFNKRQVIQICEDSVEATIEAIRKQGEHFEPGWYPDIGLDTKISGTDIFIPDDEES